VYVNLAFALIWLSYSSARIKQWRSSALIDRSVYLFLAVIVASATVLFEEGAVRFFASLGFAVLAACHIRKSIQSNSESFC